MSLWSRGARTRLRPACPVLCAHCGLPAPAPIQGEAGGPVFCCRTCRQIYALVVEMGDPQSVTEERPPTRAD